MALRHVPGAPAELLAPYHEGLAEEELRVTHCPDCGRMQFPPRPVCPGCASTRPARWTTVSGEGTVWSFAVFHKRYLADGPETPYTVAVVELVEGPKLVTNVVGADSGLRVGLPVRAVFEHGGERSLVKFACAA
jgi:uncharacterized protein